MPSTPTIPEWSNDNELFALMRSQLFTAVVGDIMDQAKLVRQFLPSGIKPLRDDMVVAGRAMPLLLQDLSPAQVHFAEEKPFGLMLEALDDLRKNEIYLATGGSPAYALWGELMSTRAIHLGAAGAVLNGYSRDTLGILELNFPTFSLGRFAQDQAPRGTVVDFRLSVTIEGVQVDPGDIVFGDLDGVCVIPRKWEKDVIVKAFEKVHGEKLVQKAISGGMSAVEAFKKYGVM